VYTNSTIGPLNKTKTIVEKYYRNFTYQVMANRKIFPHFKHQPIFS